MPRLRPGLRRVAAARTDVVEVVGQRVCERRALGGFCRLEARTIESRERVGIRIDHLGSRRFELRHLVRK